MNNDKILYLGGFELPDKNAAAHRVLNLGKIFESLNYEVIYCGIYNGDIKPQYQNKNYFCFKNPKSKIEWVNHLFCAKKYYGFINNFSNVKMVVLYNFPALLSYQILQFCKKRKIKCVADVTEWYCSKSNKVLFDIVKNIDSNLRMKYVNKKMDGLILVSSFLYNYYGKSKRNILIPPLVDSQDKKYKTVNFDNNFDNITLIYNGDPGKKDNLNFIFAIFDEIKSKNKIYLKIVGITKNQFLKLNNFNDKNFKFKNVRFYGRVEHSESLSLLKSSDALIFYRDDNIVSKAGFSTKFVEATTCGIPVITNLTSDLSEYIKDGENAIVLSSNINENISKLEKMSKDNIQMLKSNINTKTFDYKCYILKVNNWLKLILK